MKSAASRCIALLGFRGCGKSTLGALLAAELKRPFFDLDREIELAQGRTLREIFATDGEERFREIEEETLAGVIARPGIVLAPGGGIVLRAPNRALLRSSAFTIFLDVPPEVLIERLRVGPFRPALTSLRFEDEVRSLVAARQPLNLEMADEVLRVAGEERVEQTFARLRVLA